MSGGRIEAAFASWARFVIRHRWWAVVIPLALTLYLLTWLPRLSIDNSTEGFLHKDDPRAVEYREFRDQFDRDDRIILALDPPDVFDPAFLERLRELHLALDSELPTVKSITSLFNARTTRGEADELIVEDLLEGMLDEWPADPEHALAGLRERVLANPLYVNALISEDSDLTVVTIEPFTYSALGAGDEDVLAGFDEGGGREEEPELLTAKENDALMAAIRAVIEPRRSADFPIHVGGALAITDYINRTMGVDMAKFMGACVLIIMAILFVLFRRVSGTLLPMTVVILSVLSAIGVMIALGIPGSTAVQILPVFLLTVGICDAVHILAIVYQRLAAGDPREEAVVYAVGHSGLAVVMTSLTTAAGMMSFASAQMAPVAYLGVIAPIGVMLALAYTLLLLPAVLVIWPLRAPGEGGGRGLGEGLTRWLVGIGDYAGTHPKRVLVGAALIMAVSAAGATRVHFSHMALEWFQEDDAFRLAAEMLERELKGTMALEVVVATGAPGGIQDPVMLDKMEAAGRFAESLEVGEVSGTDTLSLVDIVKETHQALNGNDPAFRVLPTDRALVAQELLLFENGGAEDLEELVDTEYSKARISIRAPFVDAMSYGPFIAQMESGMQRIFGDDVGVQMTGFMPVLAAVVSAVIVSMGRSYAFALIIITPMMMLLLRSPKLGLISMIPNLMPVVFVLGLMGWLGWPLDASTIMIGAMVIGLAVDDTIHFMHKFQIYYVQHRDSRRATRETLSSTGAALLFTTLVLGAGFYVLGLATMVNTQRFGMLAGTATLVALLADVVVAPALMALFTAREQERERRDELPVPIGPAGA